MLMLDFKTAIQEGINSFHEKNMFNVSLAQWQYFFYSIMLCCSVTTAPYHCHYVHKRTDAC